jgi:amino acid adenylation domain-containing protein
MVVTLAHASPARPAVSSGADVLGYGGLEAWSGRIAGRLVAAGIGPGSRVAILIAPSTAMVAAALGVLRSGAAYVPLHDESPDSQLAAVLADARVAAVVTAGNTGNRLAGLAVPVIRAEDTAGTYDAALPAATAGDAAYLIYTSGSTGEPKGVVVEHAQLTASTLARHHVYPGAPVFLLVSSLAFDSSVAGLWGTLTAGGKLVVATSEEVRDPERLVRLIHRHRVTRLLCVPSLYAVLLDAAERLGMRLLHSLDTVIVAGEALPEPLLHRHFGLHSGGVALVNEYGPTETTVWASYRRFDGPGPVSIGGPVPGVRLYVLDERVQPVVQGELFIGGTGVSRGYFDRPDATARAFLPDPFAGTAGARMYRTGDLVRWTDEGTLQFLGRRDNQIKIRGYRVELEAIEAASRRVPGVRDAVVVPNDQLTALTGFVLAEPATTPESVRTELASRLPSAVIPARIRVLDSFPLTVNGKVDRGRLRTLAAEEVPVPPARGGEAITGVAAAWAEVLKLSEVPVDANFFDLGGHSLAMFQLQDALERHTGTRPSVVALFRHTTVAAQTTLIDRTRESSA